MYGLKYIEKIRSNPREAITGNSHPPYIEKGQLLTLQDRLNPTRIGKWRNQDRFRKKDEDRI